MPINPDAVGEVLDTTTTSWDSRDCMLYALGVGAGTDELEFTTENSIGVTQKVLPTMAAVLWKVPGGLEKLGTFDPMLMVHAHQRTELRGELPTEGTVTTVPRITAVWDKGNAALVDIEFTSTLQTTGEVLFVNTSSMFLRGEGGWGGERGPSVRVDMPERDADHELTYRTTLEQPLIYRLSGDRNPLHSDPQFAKLAGFDRPILHGLCTFGITGRGLLHSLCGSDPSRFGAITGRFTSPVMPGEDLTVRIWAAGEEAVFQTLGGDGRTVIDSGTFATRSA